MRFAVIDCGTNTFNLLIADKESGQKFKKVYNTRIAVKLGEGSINSGYIGVAAFERAVAAIEKFNQFVNAYKVNKVLAFATSAIRDARNGTDLVAAVQKHFGIVIQVIGGEQEAELIYHGNREAVAMDDSVSLIMDIGGGSNEYILANREQIFWKQSFNIGAARLLQRFQPSNPITEQEISAIWQHLHTELEPLHEAVKRFPPAELIGSSGAFDSVIEMIHTELDGEPLVENKTDYTINTGHYTKISRRIVASTLEERRQMQGLVPMRQDMIVISCLMIDYVLHAFRLNRFRVSTYSLKEGALVYFSGNT